MIKLFLLPLPLVLGRPINGMKKCVDGKMYIFNVATNTSFHTGDCCLRFSKTSTSACVEDIIQHSFPTSAVPRFAAAMGFLLLLWVLIAIFSLIIAYITMSRRRRNTLLAEDEDEGAEEGMRKNDTQYHIDHIRK